VDQTLAGIVEVGEEKRTCLIQLEPVGRARGRLVNSDGRPITGQAIHFGVDVLDVQDVIFTSRFGGKVITNDNGEFELNALRIGNTTTPFHPHPKGQFQNLRR